ncbi:hypothetical protein E2C01_090155 [Portunus trituberculatus]|uniref:Uncharacterized protein n=1 Tax=Portunus trituberculatus TaxID=210409 RepID=A0A5B7JKM8_PORTR|nr:hypothetical protein [Portunus trituberculatus]
MTAPPPTPTAARTANAPPQPSKGNSKAEEWGKNVEDVRLSHQDNIKILGVTIDQQLRFDQHMAFVPRQTSQRVYPPHSRGILTLHKIEIRFCMEYGVLSWLVLENGAEILSKVTSLEHNRGALAVTVFHKAQLLHTPNLHRIFPAALLFLKNKTATDRSLMNDCASPTRCSILDVT